MVNVSKKGVPQPPPEVRGGYIDAHQHFWKYDAVKDSWITDAMSVLKNDFLPDQLEPLLLQNGFEGCIAVQAESSELENAFLLTLTEKHPFIKGVVGWIDLQARNVERRLEKYKENGKLKGFRHILQGEARRDLMLKPAFKSGIALLHKYGYTYDVLVYPDQLKYVKELVTGFPEQKFVLDHLGKPYIKFKKISEWESDVQDIARCKNLYCKLSGMVTEADWQTWKPGDLEAYIDIVVEAFGVERIMFGSDWPVCLVAATFDTVLNTMKDYFSSFSKDEQDRFFRKNAIEFYNLY